ncbi:hypothetical protein BDV36DRAFT_275773 [Aspergillus pseudocaelatus]|uniref:Uncharacterized protein n=1 Tax=Aspergillus pseudocaelatus TaxID=1825620 RepID=A0ABQ6W265_9EURO|nr:hypothetical protein BDV36DRAFT_275773 [Aspergillus pseudocaelatus]
MLRTNDNSYRTVYMIIEGEKRDAHWQSSPQRAYICRSSYLARLINMDAHCATLLLTFPMGLFLLLERTGSSLRLYNDPGDSEYPSIVPRL